MYAERQGKRIRFGWQNQQRVIEEIFCQPIELSVEVEQLGKFKNALNSVPIQNERIYFDTIQLFRMITPDCCARC